MKKCNYIKRREKHVEFEALVDDTIDSTFFDAIICNSRLKSGLVAFLLLFFVIVSMSVVRNNSVSISSEDGIKLVSAPFAEISAKKSVVSIPAGTVKANPFLPYKEIEIKPTTEQLGFTLVEPPEMINEASEAARVMDTVVSGILYDKFSPSAILKIEGNDYLVKKGDVVNNYHVVNIMRDSVTVKLGSNTFTAGIGEILTEGALRHNEISNLDKKFGGER